MKWNILTLSMGEQQVKREDMFDLIRNFYQINVRIFAWVGLAKPLNILI